jgi:hypothetical protein
MEPGFSVTLLPTGLPIAPRSTWKASVDVKLVVVKDNVTTLLVDETEAGIPVTVREPGLSVIEKGIVRFAGMLLNVNRTCVLFGVCVPLVVLCVAVRQAEAKPSVTTKDAMVSTTSRFVKMVAVPLLVELEVLPPTAMEPTPLPTALITTPEVVDRI